MGIAIGAAVARRRSFLLAFGQRTPFNLGGVSEFWYSVMMMIDESPLGVPAPLLRSSSFRKFSSRDISLLISRQHSDGLRGVCRWLFIRALFQPSSHLNMLFFSFTPCVYPALPSTRAVMQNVIFCLVSACNASAAPLSSSL